MTHKDNCEDCQRANLTDFDTVSQTLYPKPDKRDKIIKILDEHNIWEHIIMNYIAQMVTKHLLFRKDGTADYRDKRWKTVEKLNVAIDLVMELDREVKQE